MMNTETLTTIILLSLLVIFLSFYILRMFSRYHKKKTDGKLNDSSQVGFVVDTFHELVSKLKDKEKELEILKKNAEDRASSIELYNENIFQSVPSGVVSFDQDMRITKINSAAEKILGLGGYEINGKKHDEIFNSPIAGIIEKRKTVERAEIRYTGHTGKQMWLGLTISPLKDSADNIIGQILVFTDLTDLKALQTQMELRERLSSLGEMSAGIAHELRNPMAVISGYTRILSKKVEGTLQSTVDAIAKEVFVMDRIIADFLSFAKPAEPLLSKVNLDELIKDCMKAYEVHRESIRISCSSDAPHLIMGDEVMLRQAITNLLQNSVESMPDGGELRVDVSVEDFLCIVISDTGHGIPENIIDKIFLPFYTTKERGTGLGLSIVHKIVISHGGSLKAGSSQNGTVFEIRLPREMIVD